MDIELIGCALHVHGTLRNDYPCDPKSDLYLIFSYNFTSESYTKVPRIKENFL